MAGGVFAIFCDNRTEILYGSNNEDWELKTLSDESGALNGSVQKIGQSPYYLDYLGIKTLESVQQFGDFQSGVISSPIDATIKSKASLLSCSMVSKTKGQYRLFFTDGTAVTLTIDQTGVVGYSFQSYDDVPLRACHAEDSSGTEHLYFGASDGNVYRMDMGNNFDGGNIDATFSLPFAHHGSPEYKKLFHKIIMETNTNIDSDTNLTVKLEYSDADPGIPASLATDVTIQESTGGVWDEVVWGAFYWDGRAGAKPEAYIDGVGTNARIIITSDDTYIDPHTIYSFTLHYSMRGLNR